MSYLSSYPGTGTHVSSLHIRENPQLTESFVIARLVACSIIDLAPLGKKVFDQIEELGLLVVQDRAQHLGVEGMDRFDLVLIGDHLRACQPASPIKVLNQAPEMITLPSSSRKALVVSSRSSFIRM